MADIYIWGLTTLSDCQMNCKSYNFFAFQANAACFCGNRYATQPSFAKVDDSECGGTVGSSLGGGWRNAYFII